MEDKKIKNTDGFADVEKLELEELDSVAGGGRLSMKMEVFCPGCGAQMRAKTGWLSAVGYYKIRFVCDSCGADKTLTNRDVQ